MGGVRKCTTFRLTVIGWILVVAGLIISMDSTSLGVFLSSTEFNAYFGASNPAEQGVLMGSNPMGGFCGCLLYGFLVSRCSRISTYRIGSLIWIIGSLIGVFATKVWMVGLSRLIKGSTVGLFQVLIASYVAEIFPKHLQGRMMALVQLSSTIAMLSVHYLCVIMVSTVKSHFSFRSVWAIEMLPAISLLALSVLLPESPQWLTLHGRYSQAEVIQNGIAHEYNKYSKDQPLPILHKWDLVSLYGENNSKAKYWRLFDKNSWRQTCMGGTLQLLVQCTGINVLLYYMVYICEMAGLEGQNKNIAASIPYFINVVLTLLPILYLDHVSRKYATVSGAIPVSLIMTAVGIVMALTGKSVPPINGNKSLTWVVNNTGGTWILSLCFAFVSVFALTLSCVPWMYTNEILPTRSKAKGLPFCMAVGWVMNFTLTLLGPIMLGYLKWGTFLILGGSTLFLGFIILLFFPDTSKLSAQQINDMFKQDSGTDVASDPATLEKFTNDNWEFKESPVMNNNNSSNTGPIQSDENPSANHDNIRVHKTNLEPIVLEVKEVYSDSESDRP